MGLIEVIQGVEKTTITSPLKLDTMQLMDMARMVAAGMYVLIMLFADESE